MTITGMLPTEKLGGARLIAARQAPSYISNLESALASADGNPVMFVEDGETGTSDILVSNLESVLFNNEDVNTSALASILESCFRNRIGFRIWWANNSPDAYLSPPLVENIESAFQAIAAGRGAHWGAAR